MLKNIAYFKDLNSSTLDELVYKLRHEVVDEGQFIFNIDEKIDKIYILTDGLVSVFLPFNENDLHLDTMKVAGSTLGQYSVLKNSALGYSARATLTTNFLVL